MNEFYQVTVVKKANVYFGGKVSSRNVLFSDGSKKTLGFMLAGEYEFGTADKEIMEILGGSMDIQQENELNWITYSEGQSFEVPANSKFKIVVKENADYCCSYIK